MPGANRRIFDVADRADLWKIHFDKPENDSPPLRKPFYVTGGLQARYLHQQKKLHQHTKMSTIKTNDGTEIYYKDWGEGQPIVFSHGWPLSADDWDTQMLFFLSNGFRVIAHDRRGHGRSTQTRRRP